MENVENLAQHCNSLPNPVHNKNHQSSFQGPTHKPRTCFFFFCFFMAHSGSLRAMQVITIIIILEGIHYYWKWEDAAHLRPLSSWSLPQTDHWIPLQHSTGRGGHRWTAGSKSLQVKTTQRLKYQDNSKPRATEESQRQGRRSKTTENQAKRRMSLDKNFVCTCLKSCSWMAFWRNCFITLERWFTKTSSLNVIGSPLKYFR